jgi:hypothetical protein
MISSKFDVLVDTADPPVVDIDMLAHNIDFLWRALVGARDPEQDNTWVRSKTSPDSKQHFVAVSSWAADKAQLVVTGSKAKADTAYESEDLNAVFGSHVRMVIIVAGTA